MLKWFKKGSSNEEPCSAEEAGTIEPAEAVLEKLDLLFSLSEQKYEAVCASFYEMQGYQVSLIDLKGSRHWNLLRAEREDETLLVRYVHVIGSLNNGHINNAYDEAGRFSADRLTVICRFTCPDEVRSYASRYNVEVLDFKGIARKVPIHIMQNASSGRFY